MRLFHFRLEGHGSRAAAWQRQRTQRVVLCQLDFKIPGQCMVARWFLRGHPGSSLWEFIDVVTTAIKEAPTGMGTCEDVRRILIMAPQGANRNTAQHGQHGCCEACEVCRTRVADDLSHGTSNATSKSNAMVQCDPPCDPPRSCQLGCCFGGVLGLGRPQQNCLLVMRRVFGKVLVLLAIRWRLQNATTPSL